jgi:hypothetical protein
VATHAPVATPSATPVPQRVGTSATANGAQIAIYSDQDGEVTQTLDNPNAQGVPLTFLVVEQSGG